MTLALVAAVLLPGALAWETDQYTAREVPLPDAAPLLDARMDQILTEAAAATNQRTACQGSDQEQREALAREIYRRAGAGRWIVTRGWLLGFGYSRFTAWIETDPEVPLRYTWPSEGQYREVRFWEGVILSVAGGAGTVRIGDLLVGTDKLHHFLDEGWTYARVSGWGADWPAALARGRFVETSFFGLMSSSAFSYGDLRADLDGGHFYVGLLGPGSAVRRGTDGCLARTGDFHWADWVGPEYDEFVNPSHYTRPTQRGLDRLFDREGERICRLWRALPPEQQALRFVQAPPYAPDPPFERQDPYRVAERCQDR